MSNVGKWDQWYEGLDPNEPQPYGDTTTYDIAEEFLADLDVEDWGCGKGYFRTVHRGGYIGLDGSQTPFADKIVDLCAYKSHTPGLLLRHVIEHNDNWSEILLNAVTSTEQKMALILFTPMADPDATKVIARPADIGVPDISFNHEELMDYFLDFSGSVGDYSTATQYGTERVYLLERN